jgi:hypothetical protein
LEITMNSNSNGSLWLPAMSALSIVLLLLSASTASAVNFTINGSVGDLDGNGDAGAGEAAVIQAAVGCWATRVSTNRGFTLNVSGASLTGMTTGQGSVSSVDGNNIPTAGNLRIDNDGSTNWVIDATPLDNVEFQPDPNSQWRFTNGPAGSDLFRTVIHEVGHATGWLCGTTCGFTNPRYEAMYNPQPANFVSAPSCTGPFPLQGQPPLAGCVTLAEGSAPHPFSTPLRGDGLGGSSSSIVNELSHPGVAGDLMIGFGTSGLRETPSFLDVDMYAHAYGDSINLPPTINAGVDIVSECSETGGSTITLDATGSTDPEFDSLTYAWSCSVALSDPAAAMPTAFFAKGPVVTCRVDATDLAACNPDADTVNVTVVDTTEPLVTAPDDVTAECESPTGTSVSIGTATAVDVCDPTLTVESDAPASYPLGETTVTWTSTDDDSNQGSDTQIVTVEDTTPPDLSVTLSETTLWSPDHKMVEIEATIEVSDICDANPTVELVSIVSNEPDNDKADGNTVDDIQGATVGTDDRVFEIRAERSGTGTGRVYTITYEASDASGNTTVQQVAVFVPHDQG